MPFNDRLFSLLSELDESELRHLWCEALRCRPEQDDFSSGTREWRIACVSKEWRAIHGHTLLNLTRSPHEYPWKAILVDVADKLNPGLMWTSFKLDDTHEETEIEQAILTMVDARMKEAWAKMSDQQRAEMTRSLNAELETEAQALGRTAQLADIRGITVTSLSSGIAAGLLSGTGALALVQGTGIAAVGGMFGGVLYQIGLWLVVRLLGVWSGVQLVASGGAAAVGGMLLSLPATVAFGLNAAMTTSYRKSIPATLYVLAAHEMRRQLSATA